MFAEEIIADAAREINDSSFVRWSKNELIGFLNDGQREVVKFRPNATSTLKSVQLVAGVNQAIPLSDGYRFLTLTANRGSDGLAYGLRLRHGRSQAPVDDPRHDFQHGGRRGVVGHHIESVIGCVKFPARPVYLGAFPHLGSPG